MDIRTLVRDASRVHAALKELPDGSVVTTKGCKIYIPQRYVDKKMAYVGLDNYIIGIYAIVVEDKYYGVSTINSMIPIDPTDSNKIRIDEDDYIEFIFDPGSTVFKSTNLVKTDTIVYRIFDEFFDRGHVPWYISYEDLGGIFDSAPEFAGARIGQNREVTELLASTVARDPHDRTQYYRTSVTSLAQSVSNPPIYLPLRSVQYAATNTTAKLGGAYFQQGIVSALNDASTRSERIERILRT